MTQPIIFKDIIIDISNLPEGVLPRIVLMRDGMCRDSFISNVMNQSIPFEHMVTIVPRIEANGRASVIQIEPVQLVESPIMQSTNPNQAVLMDTPREVSSIRTENGKENVEVEITIEKSLDERYLEFCKKYGKDPSILEKPFFCEKMCHFIKEDETTGKTEVTCLNGNECSYAHSKEELKEKFEILKYKIMSSIDDKNVQDLIEKIFKCDYNVIQKFLYGIENGKIPFKVKCRNDNECDFPNCIFAHTSENTDKFGKIKNYEAMIKSLYHAF